MDHHDLLLPPTTRLVHIGPHKTGTTSVQSAFHVGRKRLKRHQVHYAGAREQPLLAALAIAGGVGMLGDRAADAQDWTDLVDEVRDAGDKRVVVSSEFLCVADDDAARRVVTELVGGPVHVVITLRSVAQIAPSQWQQYVQNGLRVPYLVWLDGMFRRSPYDKPTPSFWRRHTHGELVRRWSEAVGPDNLTVVVADESNPDLLLRTFEGFVGLPEGSLVPTKNAANRSLARGEIELVRMLNKAYADRGLSDDSHVKFVRHGASRAMKIGRSPLPGEARLTLPDWALERAAERGADTVEQITTLGVRVIGDLATLAEVPEKLRGVEADLAKVPSIPAEAVAYAALGAIRAGGRAVTDGDLKEVLSTLSTMKLAGKQSQLNGMPQIAADVAACAVLALIEAAGTKPDVSADEAPGKDESPDDATTPEPTAAFAVLAAIGAAGAGKYESGTLSVMTVPTKTKPASTTPPVARRVSLEKRQVSDVRARDLLRVIALRARRRVRRS